MKRRTKRRDLLFPTSTFFALLLPQFCQFLRRIARIATTPDAPRRISPSCNKTWAIKTW